MSDNVVDITLGTFLIRKMLEDGGQDMEMVCAILKSKGESNKVVHNTPEYGDEDGINTIQKFIKEAAPFLEDGHSIHLERFQMTLSDLRNRQND